MFAITLIAVLIAVAAIVGPLVTVVRNDRSLIPPRSHTHELDQRSTSLYRVV